LIDLADQAGYAVNSPRDPASRAGTVTLRPGDHAYEISRELLARNLVIDYREGAGIRVAPHFYNTDAEIHQVMGAITDILADGSWERHSKGRSFVT
jgi:kynureninase